MNSSSWKRGESINTTKKDDFFHKNKQKQKQKQQKRESIIFKDNPQHTDDSKDTSKEFNLYDHPEMFGDTLNTAPVESTLNYLEKCMIQKKIEQENILPNGWIAFSGKKGSLEYKVSRDNKNYFDSIEQTYSSDEIQQMNYNDYIHDIEHLNRVLDNIYLKRLNESLTHFQVFNEKDTFYKEMEINHIRQLEFDKLDEELEESSESEYSDDELYDSDNS